MSDDPTTVKDLCSAHCDCGHDMAETNFEELEKRQVFDLPKKMELEPNMAELLDRLAFTIR